MLQPKIQKYRKQFRAKRAGMAKGGSSIAFGDYGLKAETRGWMSARQIEAARRAAMRFMKRGGKLWIRIFPDKPYTKSAAETPMGSGKGGIEGYVAVIKPGRVLFEISGITEAQAREALDLASHKLSVKTRFVISDRNIRKTYATNE